MAYEVPTIPGEEEAEAPAESSGGEWPMWEVFVRAKRGLSRLHVGSLHAADAAAALESARDVYTRRGEGVSVWVVRSDAVHAFEPEAAADYTDANQKIYRLAEAYNIPDEAGKM